MAAHTRVPGNIRSVGVGVGRYVYPTERARPSQLLQVFPTTYVPLELMRIVYDRESSEGNAPM